MQVGSVGSYMPVTDLAASANVQSGVAIHVLEESLNMQADMVMTLLAVGIENHAAAQKMELAGQIIDTYA